MALSDFGGSLDKGGSKRSGVKFLRGKVWLSYLLLEQKLTHQQISARYLEGRHGGQPSLIHKWINGTTSPSPQMAERIGKDFPASKALFTLPLWSLLENKPLSKATVQELMSPYWERCNDGLCIWNFPSDEFARANYPTSSLIREDSKALFERGDVYGFMAIASLVREAEAQREPVRHWLLLSDLYRSIPAIAKAPWIGEHLDLLKYCVEDIHRRSLASVAAVRVDWNIIHSQIHDQTYETIRAKRIRDPNTLRFCEPQDPVTWKL